jgi:hypothetical protein
MENETFQDYLKEEQDLIDSSIKDIDDLYAEVKEHLDHVKRSFSKGSLNFIQGQTSNLISLKTAKTNLISSRINIKKLEADLTLKKQARESNENDSSQMVMNLAKEILNMKEEKPKEVFEEKINEIDADLLLEQRLSDLENNGSLKYTDNDLKIKYENSNIKVIVVRKNDKWKFLALDSNNKQVKDYPLPKSSEVELEFIEDSKGRVSAKDENGNLYQVKDMK